jgi:hypothetical protein
VKRVVDGRNEMNVDVDAILIISIGPSGTVIRDDGLFETSHFWRY